MIFFDSFEHPQPGGKFLRATAAQKRSGRQWVANFEPPGGGTDPEAALMRALGLKPDAVYLLTDGEFDPTIAERVRQANKQRTAIHTISFVTRDAESLLKLIASESGGDYRFVP